MSVDKTNPRMVLWDQVCTTPQAMTKQAEIKGRMFTSINSMYIIRRATEVFGPIGKGWGYEVLEERFDLGAPILGKNGAVIGNDQMHTVKLKLWYLHAGRKNHVIQYGNTPFVTHTYSTTSTDYDAPKKSLTDAIKKCLSLVGFSADVFLGLYDSEDYLVSLALATRLEEAGETGGEEAVDAVLSEAHAGFNAWLEGTCKTLGDAPNVRALDLMYRKSCETAREKAASVNYSPDEAEARLRVAYDAKELDLAAI